MRVLVVGNASLSDLIVRAESAPVSSAVALLADSPGSTGKWLPGGAATTIALALRERGHAVELCHPLSRHPADRAPGIADLMGRGIGITRSPLVDGPFGRCILVYGGAQRFAWSVPPSPIVVEEPDAIVDGIDYVVVAPVWTALSVGIVDAARRRGIACAMVGEFTPGAASQEWDTVILDKAQHERASSIRATTLVVTDGEQGSTVSSGQDRIAIAAVPATVIDTTGAGDTYGGAFIAARLDGDDLRTAGDYASRMASLCCAGEGSWAAYVGRVPAAPVVVARRDRVLGALWGTACGDAFGMPNSFLEELPWRQRMEPAPDNSPYHAGYPAGRITDDTEQAIALTEALLDDFTPSGVAVRLNEWFIGVGGEKSLAVGPSTKRAMLAFARGDEVTEIGRYGVTNGSAMRVAPVGVFAGLRNLPLGELVDHVELSCVPTHNTSPAISGASAIAAAVAAAMEGRPWADVIANAIAGATEGATRGNWIYAPDIAERIRLALGIADTAATPAEFAQKISAVVGTGEPCTESVPAAIATAHYAKGDPALAIELCANSRGDTDTTAAMAGGICGAFMGYCRIPTEWRSLVASVNKLDVEAWADKLQRAALQ